MTRILLIKQLIKFWWQDVLAFRIIKRIPTGNRTYANWCKRRRPDHSTMWSDNSDDYYGVISFTDFLGNLRDHLFPQLDCNPRQNIYTTHEWWLTALHNLHTGWRSSELSSRLWMSQAACPYRWMLTSDVPAFITHRWTSHTLKRILLTLPIIIRDCCRRLAGRSTIHGASWVSSHQQFLLWRWGAWFLAPDVPVFDGHFERLFCGISSTITRFRRYLFATDMFCSLQSFPPIVLSWIVIWLGIGIFFRTSNLISRDCTTYIQLLSALLSLIAILSSLFFVIAGCNDWSLRNSSYQCETNRHDRWVV